MITILSTIEYPPDEEFGTPAILHCEIEINGLPLAIGGLAIFKTKAELKAHLESRYNELLEAAQQKVLEQRIKKCPELIDIQGMEE